MSASVLLKAVNEPRWFLSGTDLIGWSSFLCGGLRTTTATIFKAAFFFKIPIKHPDVDSIASCSALSIHPKLQSKGLPR